MDVADVLEEVPEVVRTEVVTEHPQTGFERRAFAFDSSARSSTESSWRVSICWAVQASLSPEPKRCALRSAVIPTRCASTSCTDHAGVAGTVAPTSGDVRRLRNETKSWRSRWYIAAGSTSRSGTIGQVSPSGVRVHHGQLTIRRHRHPRRVARRVGVWRLIVPTSPGERARSSSGVLNKYAMLTGSFLSALLSITARVTPIARTRADRPARPTAVPADREHDDRPVQRGR